MPVVSLIWVSVSRPLDFCGRPGRRPDGAAAAAARGAAATAFLGRPGERFAGAAAAAGLAARAGRPGRRLLAAGRSGRGAEASLRGRPRLPAVSTLISSKTGSPLSGERCFPPCPAEGIRSWYIFLYLWRVGIEMPVLEEMSERV